MPLAASYLCRAVLCRVLLCRALQQQLHVLHQLNKVQIPVLLSDIRTLWVQDAAAHIQAATAAAAAATPQVGCCDVVVSPGVFPFDVTAAAGTTAGHPLLQQALAAANAAANTTGACVVW